MPLEPDSLASEPSRFEAAVLQRIAERCGDDSLRTQLAGARILARKPTGVGCYSTLLVPGDAPRTTAPYGNRGPLGGPYFEAPGVEHGGGTALWFEAGRAKCLEIFAMGDFFPADPAEIASFELIDAPDPPTPASSRTDP